MVNLNANVKNIDLNSIFDTLSDKDKLEIVFYFYTNSPRRDAFYSFFTTFDESDATEDEVTMYGEITNIFYVFAFARHVIFDMTLLQLFTFIDAHFDYDWLSLLSYASERSYRVEYYAIVFIAVQNGLLSSIDVNSILRGELEEDFERVILEREFSVDKIEELNMCVTRYVETYKHNM
jgi:hypothetical protein